MGRFSAYCQLRRTVEDVERTAPLTPDQHVRFRERYAEFTTPAVLGGRPTNWRAIRFGVADDVSGMEMSQRRARADTMFRWHDWLTPPHAPYAESAISLVSSQRATSTPQRWTARPPLPVSRLTDQRNTDPDSALRNRAPRVLNAVVPICAVSRMGLESPAATPLPRAREAPYLTRQLVSFQKGRLSPCPRRTPPCVSRLR